ncbi:MAG: polyhydroxyalkanoic acid system family protein [Candidatus Woesearchaeota archaeon]
MGINVTQPHRLSPQSAKAAVDGLVDELATSQGGRVTKKAWNGYQLYFGVNIRGATVSGAITIGQQSVSVTGDLPFLLRGYTGKVQTYLQQQLAQRLR